MIKLEDASKLIEHWGIIAASATAIGICITGIWKYVVKIGWDRLVEVHDFLTEAIPTLTTIADEFRPNGGSTLKDALDRIEVSLARNASIATVILQETADAVFITDGEGNCTWVNDAYTLWTGLSVDAAYGRGWHEAIALQSRADVFREWDRAVAEKTNFIGHYTWTNGVTEFPVRCRTKLTIGTKGKLVGAIGVVKRLD